MDWPVANKCPKKNILFASGASYLSCPSLPQNMVLVSYSAPAFVMIPPKKCLSLKQRKSQFLPPITESMKPTSLRSCVASKASTMEFVPKWGTCPTPPLRVFFFTKYGRFCPKEHFLASFQSNLQYVTYDSAQKQKDIIYFDRIIFLWEE